LCSPEKLFSSQKFVVMEGLRGSFHESIGPVLKVAQFFGLMPVDNVAAKDITRIHFHWTSIKSIYSLVFLITGSIECLLSFKLLLKRGITLGYSSALTFYLMSMIGAVCLFILATKWNRIMKFWFESEKVFLKAPYTLRGWPLKRKIWLWAAAVGLFALGELCTQFAFVHLLT
jgi:gustatory receptor